VTTISIDQETGVGKEVDKDASHQVMIVNYDTIVIKILEIWEAGEAVAVPLLGSRTVLMAGLRVELLIGTISPSPSNRSPIITGL
jgi:hypothetical protein